MGLIKFLGGTLMIMLFAFAVLSYTIGYGNDNNVAVNIGDDKEISGLQTNLESNSGSFLIDINSSLGAFAKSEIGSGEEIDRKGGQFKAQTRSPFDATKNIIDIGFVKIFGRDTGFGIILTTFIAFIGAVSLLYIMKAWVGKNPD